MKVRLNAASELGPLVKATRKHQGLRQDATAEGIGVSENFLGRVERGAETVQWGKLFEVFKELGLYVEIDVPEAVMMGIQQRKELTEMRNASSNVVFLVRKGPPNA